MEAVFCTRRSIKSHSFGSVLGYSPRSVIPVLVILVLVTVRGDIISSRISLMLWDKIECVKTYSAWWRRSFSTGNINYHRITWLHLHPHLLRNLLIIDRTEYRSLFHHYRHCQFHVFQHFQLEHYSKNNPLNLLVRQEDDVDEWSNTRRGYLSTTSLILWPNWTRFKTSLEFSTKSGSMFKTYLHASYSPRSFQMLLFSRL